GRRLGRPRVRGDRCVRGCLRAEWGVSRQHSRATGDAWRGVRRSRQKDTLRHRLLRRLGYSQCKKPDRCDSDDCAGLHWASEVSRRRLTMVTMRPLGILAVLSCIGAAHAQNDTCAPRDGLEFVCGPKNGEDLVSVPGTEWIISSGMSAGAGVYLIDSRDGAWSSLQPQARHDAAAFPSCAAPPPAATLNAHGLNVRAGANGRSTLYVVGHGAREAIEIFEVGASGTQQTLMWKCW